MRIVICGAGQVGFGIAERLAHEGGRVLFEVRVGDRVVIDQGVSDIS